MKTTLIIQARMGSNRLPGKSLMMINSKFLIDFVLNRCLQVSGVDSIYLATTFLNEDDVLVDYVKKNYDVDVYRGDPINVRSRFSEIAKKEKADYIIRITGDDPFKDPLQINDALNYLILKKLDYVCNFEPRCIPVGMDVEVFSKESFDTSIRNFNSLCDLEHVTWSMRSPKFNWESINNLVFRPDTRLTIDHQKDIEYCSIIDKMLNTFDSDLSWESTKKAILLNEKSEN
jgi:spore coat polysaccharide biosynthesis protein SpsF